MLVVHATKKLLDRVGSPTVEPATLLERLPSWLDATLDAHGVPRTFIDAELAHAAGIGLAKTSNGSVVGVMNEFVDLTAWHKQTVSSDDDLIDVALELSQVPSGPLYKRHVSPDRELAAVVAESL